MPLNGRVLYREMLHDVKVLPEHRAKLNEVLKIVSGPKAPPAVPSRWECERCNIADCTFRFKEAATGTTDPVALPNGPRPWKKARTVQSPGGGCGRLSMKQPFASVFARRAITLPNGVR